ncbi:MAG: membrane protein insertion efficiency factor YidD [Clostridia bacterium]|nr:membrane protein insertion efficiency factor YidD [Clostridia bacterium]MBQ2252939.1 membrane protein insertion efficiency factor YidD [Clostridia bacterium]MBQ2731109.1 membrane protein insertion efficiency factor YidD [Clostridia bacterium]
MKYLLIWPIRFYRRFVSPHLGAHCRFTPTCSAYALTAIERFGFFKGGWLALCRICRCNPFGGSGPDPVPEAKTKNKKG